MAREVQFALMLGKLYDALRAGDVPEREAREAAEEAAAYRLAVGGLRTDLRVAQSIWATALLLASVALWQTISLRGEVTSILTVIEASSKIVINRSIIPD